MALKDVCIQENFAWDGTLATAYHYKKQSDDGKEVHKTVFHYQIPFPPDKEAIFLSKYQMLPENRLAFYKEFAQCIQRELKVSTYLKKHSVGSILTFSAAEQERDDQGVSHIYLETEEVYPILSRHLAGPSVNAITLINILYRISLIFRDIAKEDIEVVHRGFDLNEVYLNAENKILLGGFYYADCPGIEGLQKYLPCAPVNLPKELLEGNRGSQRSDIQSLAMVAWNLFSGAAHDARIDLNHLVCPCYAANEVVDVLIQGIHASDGECNSFRRKFSDAKRILNKTEYSQKMIPVRKQLLKELQIEYI